MHLQKILNLQSPHPFNGTSGSRQISCCSITPVIETPSKASRLIILSETSPRYGKLAKPACSVPIIAAEKHAS